MSTDWYWFGGCFVDKENCLLRHRTLCAKNRTHVRVKYSTHDDCRYFSCLSSSKEAERLI